MIKISGRRKQILALIFNNNLSMTPSDIWKRLMKQYRDGLIDRPITYNWIAITLRFFRELGLLETHTTNEGRGKGRKSYYRITDEGRKIFKSDDNTSV